MENVNFAKRNLLFVLISFVIMAFSCSSVKGYETHGPQWQVVYPQDYLTFTAGSAPVTITLNSGFTGSLYDGSSGNVIAEIQYSMDPSASAESWQPFSPGSSITIDSNHPLVRLRGTGITTAGMNNSLFTFSDYVYASGQVDSLRLDQTYNYFIGLDGGCYRNMFYGCDKLITPPELGCNIMPSNAGSCYYGMFEGCSNMEIAPDLPATTLADSCYTRMFYGCEKLENPPYIGAEQLGINCFGEMFKGCVGMRLSIDGTNDSYESYPYTWRFKAFDYDSGESIIQGHDSSLGMFDPSCFPASECPRGVPDLLSVTGPEKNGYVTLYSMYPFDSDSSSQESTDGESSESNVALEGSNIGSEGNINFNDTLIGYVNITLGDSGGNYIVDDPISIDDEGNINEVELKWDDGNGNGNASSLDSMDGSTKAYITVWKKQDNSYVASSRWFYLISENGKTMIPSQKMYKGFEGQAASDNVSDANVWNDKTPAVYNLSITVDAA